MYYERKARVPLPINFGEPGSRALPAAASTRRLGVGRDGKYKWVKKILGQSIHMDHIILL